MDEKTYRSIVQATQADTAEIIWNMAAGIIALESSVAIEIFWSSWAIPLIVAVLGVLNKRAISPKVTGASIFLNLHSRRDLTPICKSCEY